MRVLSGNHIDKITFDIEIDRMSKRIFDLEQKVLTHAITFAVALVSSNLILAWLFNS
jgi:hypothetical protein